MFLCVVLVMCCVVVHSLCVLCVCVGGSFHVLVCESGLSFEDVWFAVVCDVLCVCVLC